MVCRQIVSQVLSMQLVKSTNWPVLYVPPELAKDKHMDELVVFANTSAKSAMGLTHSNTET